MMLSSKTTLSRTPTSAHSPSEGRVLELQLTSGRLVCLHLRLTFHFLSLVITKVEWFLLAAVVSFPITLGSTLPSLMLDL
jgi:hypothetical protein